MQTIECTRLCKSMLLITLQSMVFNSFITYRIYIYTSIKLILPVQRLPRYELLLGVNTILSMRISSLSIRLQIYTLTLSIDTLQDLLKSTERDHSDYLQVEKALEEVKKMNAFLNQKKLEADSLNRMLQVQEKSTPRAKKVFIVSYTFDHLYCIYFLPLMLFLSISVLFIPIETNISPTRKIIDQRRSNA